MSKTCKELFSGIECSIIGDENEEVCGLAYRSDQVVEKDVFFCIVGMNIDGHSFAQEAIDRGARVLVVERKIYLADATEVTEVVVNDSRKAMALAAANFYDHPSLAFDLVGITGTNGKTTTSYLVENIARVAGKHTGVIGTVGIHIGNDQESSLRTTPESSDLQKLFQRMKENRCEVVAMEVSSHALDLERIWSTRFGVTVFTNLTQDHLDYHKTFESYFEAKARLFSQDYPAKRVICIDDSYGKELLRRCSGAEESVITTGFDSTAQICPLEVDYRPISTKVTLDVRGSTYSFEYPLVGRFNVENIMSAFGVGMQLGISPSIIIEALSVMPQIPGRLERVASTEEEQAVVYVDYAHTPDALEKAINSLRTLAPGRLFVVFGCGGDRDASKRPLMGKAALKADYVLVTSDNPRTEDPQSIIDDILPGMVAGIERYQVLLDRREAIKRAIELAESGDIILIAGKGHEDYQIIGTQKIPFDDRKVAAEELAQNDRKGAAEELAHNDCKVATEDFDKGKL